MFGGDTVFGSNTDENNLKPVFDAAMVKSLKLIDTNPLVTATLNKSAIK